MKILIGGKAVREEVGHLETLLAIRDMQLDKVRAIKGRLSDTIKESDEDDLDEMGGDYILGYISALKKVDGLLYQVVGDEDVED